jgi:tRNA (cmo5U34)-methyltransferase
MTTDGNRHPSAAGKRPVAFILQKKEVYKMLNKPEEMAAFFDSRVEGYDEHMQGMFKDFNLYYENVAGPITETRNVVNILDLGCGTGNELRRIFQKAPNARVKAIDLSNQMLKKLMIKYKPYLGQMEIVRGSYLTIPFEEAHYDYVVSVYTMHHFTADTKRKLYTKILRSLKPGGKYIEGDCVVSPEKEQQLLENYYKSLELVDDSQNKLYHMDIPFSIETQIHLFKEAGFSKVDVIYHREDEEAAILVAQS